MYVQNSLENPRTNYLPSIFRTRLVPCVVCCLNDEFNGRLFPLLPPFSLLTVLDRNFRPISKYNTVISVIGIKNINMVDNSNECWIISFSTVHSLWPNPFSTTSNWIAKGKAMHSDSSQITIMYLMALDSFDIVRERKGWQIATNLRINRNFD